MRELYPRVALSLEFALLSHGDNGTGHWSAGFQHRHSLHLYGLHK